MNRTPAMPGPDTATGAQATSYCLVDTPFDLLLVVGTHRALRGLYVARHERCPSPGSGWVEDPEPFDDVRRQLSEYFGGRRTAFDLPLDLSGTPFQVAVWEQIGTIPFGETISYAELARRVNRPGAARAAGAATGRNPVSIVVPCHRVVGSDGSLTGYGWGPERKTWLLAHERSTAIGGKCSATTAPEPVEGQGQAEREPGTSRARARD